MIVLRKLCLTLVLFCLVNFGCNKSKNYQKVKDSDGQTIDTILSALPIEIKSPLNNPLSSNKVNLGRLLFFDPILSGNKDVACATCHHPKNGYAEFRDLSIGSNGIGFGNKRVFKQPNQIPFVKRNAHTILNTAYNGIDNLRHYHPEKAPMFWDLRVNGLENQAIEPLKAFEEMRGVDYSENEILDEIVHRLKSVAEYQKLFDDCFSQTNNTITIENISKAIAAFERTLVTNNSRFDKYMRGDHDAISLDEAHGLKLFKEVGCVNCHNGPMFSDFKIHVLSVPDNPKLDKADTGFENTFGFRTPTLRNLRFTDPYMHNGAFPTLEKVLNFYEDLTFNKSLNPKVDLHQIDPLVKKLKLSVKEMTSIISFLNTLNDDTFDKTVPNRVPSGLMVGGNINE